MRKFRASVSVTALVTVSVLLVLTLALINLTYFMMQTSQMDLERGRAQWFLEGRIQEYFDQVMGGKRALESGSYTYKEKIDGTDRTYTFNITTTDQNLYKISADLKWKEQLHSRQVIEFYRFNLFDYSLVFLGNARFKILKNCVIYGNIATKGSITFDGESRGSVFFHHSSQHPYRIDYLSDRPSWNSSVFTNSRESLLAQNNDIELPVTQRLDQLGEIFFQKNSLTQIKMPDFNTIWEGFNQYRDSAWILGPYNYLDKETIVNPNTTIKELIAFGSGFSSQFSVGEKSTRSVYIMNTKSGIRRQIVPSIIYSSANGVFNTWDFFQITNNRLYLGASIKPVPIELPDEAFESLDKIKLYTDNWSVISVNEDIKEIYLDELSLRGRLTPGTDYEYNAAERTVRFTAPSYFRNNEIELGYGDGYKKEFPVPLFSVRVLPKLFFFENNRKIKNFQIDRNMVIFEKAPAKGAKVSALKRPQMYILKEPPSDRAGIFLDISDQAAIIDLSKQYRQPQNGVIVATVPLIIRGTANFPIAIISTENIYLENINTPSSGYPVLAVSGRGVWFHKTKSISRNQVYQTFVYTPLSGIGMVNEEITKDVPTPYFSGSIICAGEQPSQSMEDFFYSGYYIYDPSILNALGKKPFSLFPMPFQIQKVKRM